MPDVDVSDPFKFKKRDPEDKAIFPQEPQFPKQQEVKNQAIENVKATKISTSRKFLSAFSSSAYDLDRINDILRVLDALNFRNNAKDPSVVRMFYSGLYGLFIYLRPFMSEKEKMDWDNSFSIIQKITNNPQQLPKDIFIILQTAYKDLIQFRQEVGLGIGSEARISLREKIKRGMNV